MKTYLFTPTGYRHKHFALCEKWVSRFQESYEWVVVDDDPNPVTCTMGQTLIKRKNDFRGHTLGLNTKTAIDYCGSRARIVVIEDDVWYHPEYLGRIMELWDRAELVGTAPGFIYHVGKKMWRIMPSGAHASYSETAVRDIATTQLLRHTKRHTTSLDACIWRTQCVKQSERFSIHLEQLTQPWAVSMKGHQQQRVLGSFHHETPHFFPDPELLKLREWIGDDAQEYYSNEGNMI